MFPGSRATFASVGYRKPQSLNSFSVHAARGWNGRSCQRSECCGARCCALKGLGQISPGQSVAPPRVVVAIGSPSPERAAQTDASIVSPLQGFFAAMGTLPRATATLVQLASPCPGLICRAPSGQRRRERKERAARLARPGRHGDGWPGSDSRTLDAKKMLATAAAAR